MLAGGGFGSRSTSLPLLGHTQASSDYKEDTVVPVWNFRSIRASLL